MVRISPCLVSRFKEWNREGTQILLKECTFGVQVEQVYGGKELQLQVTINY